MFAGTFPTNADKINLLTAGSKRGDIGIAADMTCRVESCYACGINSPEAHSTHASKQADERMNYGTLGP